MVGHSPHTAAVQLPHLVQRLLPSRLLPRIHFPQRTRPSRILALRRPTALITCKVPIGWRWTQVIPLGSKQPMSLGQHSLRSCEGAGEGSVPRFTLAIPIEKQHICDVLCRYHGFRTRHNRGQVSRRKGSSRNIYGQLSYLDRRKRADRPKSYHSGFSRKEGRQSLSSVQISVDVAIQRMIVRVSRLANMDPLVNL